MEDSGSSQGRGSSTGVGSGKSGAEKESSEYAGSGRAGAVLRRDFAAGADTVRRESGSRTFFFLPSFSFVSVSASSQVKGVQFRVTRDHQDGA